ncbi:Sec-independent protein translocase protein TatC [subsurface metagenome]
MKYNQNGEMPLLDHIRELRKKIIVSLIAVLLATIVSYIFYETIISFLFAPFQDINRLSQAKEILYVNTLFEGFLIRIKVAVFAGIVFSSPVHVYNLVKFFFPGLQANEKKIILISLITSFILIVFSFYYGYFKVIPISVKFLSGSVFIPAKVGMLLNYSKNIFYIFQFLLITLLLFQLPIVLEILMIMNMLSRKTLLKSSRFIIVGIFIFSAILTPPDFISQVSLALPLILLFFLTILIAKIFNFGTG